MSGLESLRSLEEQVNPSTKTESTQRYCEFWKASNGKWYMDLAPQEHGEYDDANTYGPFSSEAGALRYLSKFSNPGSYSTDDSGTRPPPTKSPSGRKVFPPT